MDCTAGRHGFCENGFCGSAGPVAASQPSGERLDYQNSLSSSCPPSLACASNADMDAAVSEPDFPNLSGREICDPVVQRSGQSSICFPDAVRVQPPVRAGSEATNRDEFPMIMSMIDVYDEIVHWRKRFFSVPAGGAGNKFVAELARLVRVFVESNGEDSDALYSFFILPALVLQRVSEKSRSKEDAANLARRMELWDSGNLNDLMDECRSLQHHLEKSPFCPKVRVSENLDDAIATDEARRFGQLVSQGKVQEAIRCLSANENSAVLQADDLIECKTGQERVSDVLKEKHPAACSAANEALLDGPPKHAHEVIFQSVTAARVRQTALHMNGSAGPSGLDSHSWRRIFSQFGRASQDLCTNMASLARLLCTKDVSKTNLIPLLACRLVALNKNPGVRPIGVCEVIRRIVAKVVVKVAGIDIEEACGVLQTCSGLPSGIEATVHAMQSLFSSDTVEGVLMVDAKNAFNSLNREAASAQRTPVVSNGGNFCRKLLWYSQPTIYCWRWRNFLCGRHYPGRPTLHGLVRHCHSANLGEIILFAKRSIPALVCR